MCGKKKRRPGHCLAAGAKAPRRHLPHDGRHTCITRLNDAEVNERTIQLIVGHSGSGVTQSVYTHKTIAQLIEAINRIQP